MPLFFDPVQLTPEQKARYPQALDHYAAVMQSNFERHPQALREALRALHQPGPKSALFARLLAGKAPLPDPPPLAYSYPWYAVVEETGPHPVFVEGLASAGAPGATVLINQHPWQVIELNAAARQLLARLADARQAPAPPGPGIALPYARALAEALAAGPQLRVATGPWEGFVLRPGRIRRSARRREFLRSVLCLEDLTGGEPEAVPGTAPDADWVDYTCSGWVLERDPQSVGYSAPAALRATPLSSAISRNETARSHKDVQEHP